MSKTRSQTEIFGLGEGLTEEDSVITGCRLPTSKQILRCFAYHLLKKDRTTTYEAGKHVYELTIPFYQKGGIPMLADKTCIQKIEKLWLENQKLRRIPEKKRSDFSVKTKLDQYKLDLEKTFPLLNSKAESLIKNEDDLHFLQSMKTDRVASIAGFDVSTDKYHQRVAERQSAEGRRKAKNNIEIQSQFQISDISNEDVGVPSTSSDSHQNEDSQFLTLTPVRSHKRIKKDRN